MDWIGGNNRIYSPAGSIPRCMQRVRIENVFASGSFRAVYGRAYYSVACGTDSLTGSKNFIPGTHSS